MKTLAELSAFWQALPAAASFAHTFAAHIAAVEANENAALMAENAARTARAHHNAALAALHAQVAADASANWSPYDIEVAAAHALPRSLKLAGTP